MANFSDSDFVLYSDADPTKQLTFDCTNLTTATLRTLQLPDFNGTLVVDSAPTIWTAAQTFQAAATVDGVNLLVSNGLFILETTDDPADDLAQIILSDDFTGFDLTIKFPLAGYTAARTQRFPDATGTLMLIDSPQTISAAHTFTGAPEYDADQAGGTALMYFKDITTGKIGSLLFGAGAPSADWTLTLPTSTGVLAHYTAAPTAGRVLFAGSGGAISADADMTFATDTLTATKIVGTTSIKVGTAAGYKSSDGSAGATGTFTTVDLKTVTVKDGIITAIV